MRTTLRIRLELFLGALALFAAVSCSEVAKEELSEPSLPNLDDKGPLIRFQSFIFSTPAGYQVLEDSKEAHVAGVFSAEEGEKLIQRLKVRRGFELQSTPALTCRNNESGKVEVIREFTYPTEYDPPQIPKEGKDGNGIFPVTPSSPKSFETRKVGIEATFKGRKKGETIDFELDLERTSFLGFVNYGSPITAPARGFLGQTVEVVITENRIEMPVFDVKKLAAKVSLTSGQYLAIGGLSADLQPSLEEVALRKQEKLQRGETLFVLIRVEGFE